VRIQTIIGEIGGEKIDIIEYSEDIKKFIVNSLAPAKVSSIEINEKERFASVKIKRNQLSLAIGRDGQNVRLAAKLTGWRIDVQAETELEAEAKDEPKDEPKIEEEKNLSKEKTEEKSEEKIIEDIKIEPEKIDKEEKVTTKKTKKSVKKTGKE
jgi:N utilization substance protein A